MYNIVSSRVEPFEVYYFLLKFYLTISFKFFSRIFRFLKFRAREKYQILPVNHISSIPSYHIPFNIHHSSLRTSLRIDPPPRPTISYPLFQISRVFPAGLRLHRIKGSRRDHHSPRPKYPSSSSSLSKRTEPQQKRWNLDGGTVSPEGISWTLGDVRTRCTRLYLQALIHMYPISMHITSE